MSEKMAAAIKAARAETEAKQEELDRVQAAATIQGLFRGALYRAAKRKSGSPRNAGKAPGGGGPVAPGDEFYKADELMGGQTKVRPKNNN